MALEEIENLNLDQSSSFIARPNHNYDFLNQFDLGSEVNRRLALNLDRIVSGSDDVYLSPIGKANGPDSLLSDLDEIFENNQSLIDADLLSLELNNKAKFGPRSLAAPWSSRKKSMLAYYENDKRDVAPLVLKGFKDVKRNLRPIPISKGIELLKNSTNSGLPYFTRKGLVKDRTVLNFKSQLEAEYPCVLFTRTQEGGKTRNVWGYPMVDTLNEMLYYKPLLDYQKRLEWRSSLLGPEHVDRAVTSLISESHLAGKSLLSVDFSGFDSTVTSDLQESCFDYINSLFQEGYQKDIDYIKYRFNTIGIITPDGILTGPHGVPSGSTFTNEVDSIAQFRAYQMSGVSSKKFQIQGDDGLYSLSTNEYEALKGKFLSCGLVLNDEKSYFNDRFCVFLQKLYSKAYIKDGLIGGIYPLYRALNRIIYQERYSNFEDFDLSGQDYYSIRTISILENCKYHPLFEVFVRFIISKDKYLLKFSRSSLSNYSRMADMGKAGVGVIINQYGDDISGIENFATVKLINSIS